VFETIGAVTDSSKAAKITARGAYVGAAIDVGVLLRTPS
jgi:hypothetical protein